MTKYLLQTIGLKKYFETPHGFLHAVDNVNIEIEIGKTLGVVGESGCGKTTLGRTVLRLLEPTSGRVLFNGEDIVGFSREMMKKIRPKMQIIFQDPFSSLNPRMSVSQLIADPLIITGMIKNKNNMYNHVYELMELVGLDKRMINMYPHELDGGCRQRIGVARALALNPKFIVCDEPVSALDVSIQAQVLNLLMDLKERIGLTYMFITHDLSVVKYISSDIVVMYLGQVIEKAPTKDLFNNPCHPYTQALLRAIFVPKLNHHRDIKIETIKGELTSPIEPKPGCRFAARCPKCTEECTLKDPQLKEIASSHYVACVRV